jgi:uncharacterized protein DUF5710
MLRVAEAGGESMSQITLRVPFPEKEQARQLGARWDPRQKLWYVPEGVDPAPFKQWLPQTLEPNLRAASYFLASNKRECWRCEQQTAVHAIVLSHGHERLYVGDDPADDRWEIIDEATMLSYIDALQEPVPTRLRDLAPHYRLAYSQTTGGFYWMNHCECCGAKLGDNSTHEVGMAFGPTNSLEAAAIRLQLIREPFLGWGSYTEDLPAFEEMQQFE